MHSPPALFLHVFSACFMRSNMRAATMPHLTHRRCHGPDMLYSTTRVLQPQHALLWKLSKAGNRWLRQVACQLPPVELSHVHLQVVGVFQCSGRAAGLHGHMAPTPSHANCITLV